MNPLQICTTTKQVSSDAPIPGPFGGANVPSIIHFTVLWPPQTDTPLEFTKPTSKAQEKEGDVSSVQLWIFLVAILTLFVELEPTKSDRGRRRDESGGLEGPPRTTTTELSHQKRRSWNERRKAPFDHEEVSG